jgi:hypothetical protein
MRGVMTLCPRCKNEIKLVYDFDEFPIGDTEVRVDCPYCNNITSFVYQKLPGEVLTKHNKQKEELSMRKNFKALVLLVALSFVICNFDVQEWLP